MSWAADAACADDLAFTERPEADQLAICNRCPVTEQCLVDALAIERAHRHSHGYLATVRGGLTYRQRAQLLGATP